MLCHQTLFNNLTTLTSKDNLFFSKDIQKDDRTYRIFCYHIGSYTEFCEPDALECRGIMFDVTDDVPVLVSMPMPKFFNLFENPFTENPDFTDCKIMDKADGSLISTYMHNGTLQLKSKGSLSSDQAVMSMDLLNTPEFAELRNELVTICQDGTKTVNMEFVSPMNRIVVQYQTSDLIVLNVRDHITGNLLHKYDIDSNQFPALHAKWVKYIEPTDFTQWMADVPSMEGIEGFIIKLQNEQLIKVKVPWYVDLHKSVNDIMNDKFLFDCALNGNTDDLKGFFAYDQFLMNRIHLFETFTSTIYAERLASTNSFFDENQHLPRKDFAIKGQQILDKLDFAIVMGRYCGKEICIKDMISKHKDKFLPQLITPEITINEENDRF